MRLFEDGTYRKGDKVKISYCGDAVVYHLSNGTGEGAVTSHCLYDGMYLLFDDMHLASFGEGTGTEKGLIIEHCREGRFECSFDDGRQLYLGPGDVCVHCIDYDRLSDSRFPLRHYHGLTIMIACEPDAELSATMKEFGIDYASVLGRTVGSGGFYIIRTTEELRHIFNELYSINPAESRGYFRLKALELLMFLSRAHCDETATERCTAPKEMAELLLRVEEYMWRNLSRKLTVKELCDKFGLSPTSLKKYFKLVFGCPVYRYMQTCRMQVAACSLVGTENKISDIAHAAGYRNTGKFSAAFKEFSGVAPREYRKNKTLPDWSINTANRD